MNTLLQFQKFFCIDKLDDIVNKYNNTNHRTIKTEPVDVKSSTYMKNVKNVKVVLDLSNYATTGNLENAAGVDT